jgi:hypothetical protein
MVHPEGALAIVSAFGLAAYFIRAISQVMLKRLELKRESLGSGPIDQRLERIEQAVDAIAIEMERVSEGQRFTTKLLAERVPLASAAPSAQSASPAPAARPDSR